MPYIIQYIHTLKDKVLDTEKLSSDEVMVNFIGFMSPASDYVTMFFTLYLIARWAEEIESGKKDISAYALLCVLAVFLCTLKLSAAIV